MSDLLFEIYSEEIPAQAQIAAEKQITEIFTKLSLKTDLQYQNISAFSTPRRLVLTVSGITQNNAQSEIEKRGPRIDAPQAAIDGFLRSLKINFDQLSTQEVNGQKYYFALLKNENRSIEENIKDILDQLMNMISWPKTMRWDESNVAWIRPIRSMICLLDQQVIAIKFGNITASNHTWGHRFISPSSFAVTDFLDYKTKLETHHVMLSHQERVMKIKADAISVTKELELELIEDEELINEIAAITEYPVILCGKIDPRFLKLPAEVLICSMKKHQRYLSTRDKNNNFAPYFITAADNLVENSANIIHGNEKVLSARLRDAEFFYDSDRKTKLIDRLNLLEKVTFHSALGSMYQKVQRFNSCAAHIAKSAKLSLDHELLSRACLLSKCDLITNLVIEFPELQGVIGKYYALHDNEPEIVAMAIVDHYKPAGRNDLCPENIYGAIVSIADKLDTIIGLFYAKQPPTSSKDPYGLRRSALGIMRIAIDQKLDIDLIKVIKFALSLYNNNDPSLSNEITTFLAERFHFYLKDLFKLDHILAITKMSKELNCCDIYNRIQQLENFTSSSNGKAAILAIKRVNSFLGDSKAQSSMINPTLLTTVEEKALYETAINHNFSKLAELTKLTEAINHFCDKVTVMDSNQDIQNNRLGLLDLVRDKTKALANFDEIELNNRL